MSKLNKALTVFLCLLLVLSYVSCAAPGSENETTQTVALSVPEESTEPSRDSYPDNLPDNLDYKEAELRVLYRDSTNYREDFVALEISGDAVNDAIYNRNAMVEKRLNCKIVTVAGNSNNKTYCSDIETQILGGSAEYDLISAYQAYTVPLALKNIFADLSDTEYLDYSQPWWATDYMDEVQINSNKTFFLQGDIALFMLGSMGAVYYNKEMYTDLFGSTDEFYTTIENGEWTLDAFGLLSANAYHDTNGNGKSDAGDRFGFCATTSKSTEHFMYDAGVRSSTRNSEGFPEFTLNNEHSIAVLEKLNELYYNNTGAYINSSDGAIEGFVNGFADGMYLFLPGWLYMAKTIASDMEDDYGIIPFPKMYSTQENYLSLVHDGTTIYCIPTTVKNLDFVCAVTEACAAQSYRTVTPAYFDVALKYRYAQDVHSALILDTLRENVTTDYLYANNYSFSGSPGLICRTLLASPAIGFAGLYKTMEKRTLTTLQKLIEDYQSHN